MNFFTFYKDIKSMSLPFVTFSGIHFLILASLFLLILCFFRYYRKLDVHQQHTFKKRMAIYFFIEELLYSIWLLIFCHDRLLFEILPLQLCSLCVYVAIASVYFKFDNLRFFCGLIGTMAGLIAIVYPANLTMAYPLLSYRTINFFILHGAFILFGCIQLQDTSLLKYRNIKGSSVLLSIMVIVAFGANILWKTDYMFIGAPPSIGFIAMLYQATGIYMFLPVVIVILIILQLIVLFLLRKVLLPKRLKHSS